jgi:hypothetical protein
MLGLGNPDFGQPPFLAAVTVQYSELGLFPGQDVDATNISSAFQPGLELGLSIAILGTNWTYDLSFVIPLSTCMNFSS